MIKNLSFFYVWIFVVVILFGCVDSDDNSIVAPIVLKDFTDVIVKGDVVVPNCYKFDRNQNTVIADRQNIHKTMDFTVPSTAESVVFKGDFESNFPITVFLRDELGYAKFTGGIDEGITSDWVVNDMKSGQVIDIPLTAGKKYVLAFYFFNRDCRGLLCLGEKEPFATVTSNFEVLYKN